MPGLKKFPALITKRDKRHATQQLSLNLFSFILTIILIYLSLMLPVILRISMIVIHVNQKWSVGNVNMAKCSLVNPMNIMEDVFVRMGIINLDLILLLVIKLSIFRRHGMSLKPELVKLIL